MTVATSFITNIVIVIIGSTFILQMFQFNSIINNYDFHLTGFLHSGDIADFDDDNNPKVTSTSTFSSTDRKSVV